MVMLGQSQPGQRESRRTGALPPGGTAGDSLRAGTSVRGWWRGRFGARHTQSGALWDDVRSGHPGFVEAVLADATTAAAYRGDRSEFRSRPDAFVQAARLAIVSDAFLAQVCYRAKAACQSRRVPVLPRILHRLAMMTGQICIGDPVVIQPGVYIPHGQVVIDGLVEVGSGVVLFPFVTVGLHAGTVQGPTIGARAAIGSGAKVLGPVRVGAGARVGANAVVVSDVPDGTTVVGVPARPAHADSAPP
jgi:serine O-acetyltransferase